MFDVMLIITKHRAFAVLFSTAGLHSCLDESWTLKLAVVRIIDSDLGLISAPSGGGIA